MAFHIKPISSYKFSYQVYGRDKTTNNLGLSLFDRDNNYIGNVSFREEIGWLNNRISSSIIYLRFHKNDFPNIIDLLRNESPIYIWLNDASRLGGFGSSDKEPIGEGE